MERRFDFGARHIEDGDLGDVDDGGGGGAANSSQAGDSEEDALHVRQCALLFHDFPVSADGFSSRSTSFSDSLVFFSTASRIGVRVLIAHWMILAVAS